MGKKQSKHVTLDAELLSKLKKEKFVTRRLKLFTASQAGHPSGGQGQASGLLAPL